MGAHDHVWQAIPKKVESLDDEVPPEYRAMYVTDPAGGFKLHDLSGLQRTLGVLKGDKQERDLEISALKLKLGAFGDLTPDAASELRAQLTALTADQSDKFAYGATQRKEAEARASGLIQSKEAKLSRYEKALRAESLARAVDRALYESKHQPTKARAQAAKEMIAKRLGVELDDDGQPRVVVYDPARPKVYAVGPTGEQMNVDDVVDQVATEYPEFFKASPNSGMGSGGSAGAGGVSMASSDTSDILTWTFARRKSYQDAHGVERYLSELDKARRAQKSANEMRKRGASNV